MRLQNSLFFLVGLGTTVLVAVNSWGSNSTVRYPESAYVRDAVAAALPALQDGDLVFRRGRDLTSDLVLAQGSEVRYSHVGVIVTTHAGLSVVHAIPGIGREQGGVVLETLKTFAGPGEASDIGFARIKGVSAAQQREVHNYVIGQMEKPFDDALLMGSDDKLYCTELAIKGIEKIKPGAREQIKTIRVPLVLEPIYAPDELSRAPFLEQIPEGGARAERGVL